MPKYPPGIKKSAEVSFLKSSKPPLVFQKRLQKRVKKNSAITVGAPKVKKKKTNYDQIDMVNSSDEDG